MTFEKDIITGLIAVSFSVIFNGFFTILGASSSQGLKEGVRYGLPLIGMCFAGALSTFVATLALNYLVYFF